MWDGPTLPMIVLFLSAATVLVLRGPFGRAFAERLSGRPRHDDTDVQELRGEVDDLRQQIGEVQERLDFAERLLARQDERAGVLPKGEGSR